MRDFHAFGLDCLIFAAKNCMDFVIDFWCKQGIIYLLPVVVAKNGLFQGACCLQAYLLVQNALPRIQHSEVHHVVD